MIHYKTISEMFRDFDLPGPAHPLISAVHLESRKRMSVGETTSWFYDFYCIALKRVTVAGDITLKYGQQPYDFNGGILSFVSPGQVLSRAAVKDVEIQQSGWMIIIHPDFLWNTSLSTTIKRYDFWDYAANEALFLSEQEEETIVGIVQNIYRKTSATIDKFSKQIVISQLESLLNYAERFYNRQFITREKGNHLILDRLQKVLDDYFDSGSAATRGLPGVNEMAAALHISPKYLGSLLRMHTGQNTQQYIHQSLIERAKIRISTCELSISEIAYELGFEHLQSFSRLFKAKTNLSPMAFRQSFRNN